VFVIGGLLDGIMGDVLTVLQSMGQYVLWALDQGINQLIVAVGAALVWVLNLFPGMPTVPNPPPVVQYVNWVAPVGGMLGFFGTCVGLYLAVLAIRVLARWVKLL
jgi:hypothetical protein